MEVSCPLSGCYPLFIDLWVLSYVLFEALVFDLYLLWVSRYGGYVAGAVGMGLSPWNLAFGEDCLIRQGITCSELTEVEMNEIFPFIRALEGFCRKVEKESRPKLQE